MTTTIRVPEELRDRINRDANTRGLTAAGFIEELVNDYERNRMLTEFGRNFSSADATYQEETKVWSSIEAVPAND